MGTVAQRTSRQKKAPGVDREAWLCVNEGIRLAFEDALTTKQRMDTPLARTFEEFDHFGVAYVILRGFPLQQKDSAHPDIDMLVEDYAQTCALLTCTRSVCAPRNIKKQGIQSQFILTFVLLETTRLVQP